MARISLKIDVDTDRGTAEGAVKLAAALERLGVQATFLFSLGPDHTGRALKRVFRRGFLGKVRRTSVVEHYGVRTLLYGTLLPGPHIGRRRAGIMRAIANSGFEVGVHCHDHVKWQDHVAAANEFWTQSELERAISAFVEVFGRAPLVHGAAGWQVNEYVPELEQQLGFQYASDTRGTHPFLPYADGIVSSVAQFPTTLPTLDELIGRSDVPQEALASHLDALIQQSGADQVFTLHAELEGGRYLDFFVKLVSGWRAAGHTVGDLATYRQALDGRSLPVHEISRGTVDGRSGMLAVQGAEHTGPALQLNPLPGSRSRPSIEDFPLPPAGRAR